MKHIAPLKERQTSEFSSKPVGKGLVLEKRGTDLRNWKPLDQKFQWDQEQKKRNPGVEEIVKKGTVVSQLRPEETIVSTKKIGSQYGLGAVISYITPDATERLIALASRTLANTENNYDQYERGSVNYIWSE